MRIDPGRRALTWGALAMPLVLGPLALRAQTPGRVIKVVAKRFDYDPNEIHLKLGEPVIIELTSRDIVMGFNAPDFKVRADVMPGRAVQVSFVPQAAGTFTFFCDIFCGSGHEEMNGTFIVAA